MLPSGWPTRGAPGAGRHPRHLRSASDYTGLACMHACRPPPPPRIPSSGREPPRASKTREGLRPPNEHELRLSNTLYQQRIPHPFQHTEYTSAHCDPWHLSRASYATTMYRPPTACDRACRSLITNIAPGPRMPTKNIPARFDTRTVKPYATTCVASVAPRPRATAHAAL